MSANPASPTLDRRGLSQEITIALLYTRWVYKVIWGKLTETELVQNAHTLY